MKLIKGQRTHSLKKKIDIIDYGTIIFLEGSGCSLTILNAAEFSILLKDTKPRFPNFISLAKDDSPKGYIVIHPIPDKDYECIILGSKLIQQ